MDACQSLGDTKFGGGGTRDEDILVGYIYGVLSESATSELMHESKFLKVYRYGESYYMIWMGEYDAGDDSGGEPLILPVAVEGPFKDEDIENILAQL